MCGGRAESSAEALLQPQLSSIQQRIVHQTHSSKPLCCITVHLQALLTFRFMVGFGIPAAGVAFNWLLEFSPTRYRGVFAVAIEGFWTLGTLVQAGMAYGMLNHHGWR